MKNLQKNAALSRKGQIETRITYARDLVKSRFPRMKKANRELVAQEIVSQSEFVIFRKDNRRIEELSYSDRFNKLYKDKGRQLHQAWPYRTASMGNFYTIRMSRAIQAPEVYVGSEKLWPGESTSTDGVYGSYDTYSKSSNQSATIYQFTMNLPYGFRWAVIGELLTAWEGRLNRNKVTPVTWWEQSRGMDVRPVQGYLYKGYHIKAKDAVQAKKKVAKLRNERAAQLAEQRAKTLLQRVAKTLPLTQVWVSYEDSVASGNCSSGTRSFASKHGINLDVTGAVRADELQRMANGSAMYVGRAIHKASIRKAERIIS